MNKKIIIAAVLGLLTMTANAQFLFRISGNGLEKPSYILGTIHTLPGSLLDSIPAFLDAEAQCQQVYVESNVTDQQTMNDMANAGIQVMTLPDGKTIFDVLNKEQMDLLSSKYKEVLHINLVDSTSKSVWNYSPVAHILTFNAVMTAIEMQTHPGLGFSGMPIDVVCMSRAKERGISLGELDEKLNQEHSDKAHNEMTQNLDAQVDSLMAFLNSIEERRQGILKEQQFVAQTSELWRKGDFDSFATDGNWLSEIEKNPVLYKERNDKWVPKILAAMRKAPTMFVFGAGHLVGKDGVIQQLSEAGYNVEQVKERNE